MTEDEEARRKANQVPRRWIWLAVAKLVVIAIITLWVLRSYNLV